MKIAIARHNYRLLIGWILNHGMQNQLRVAISLGRAVFVHKGWLKNTNLANFLQIGVQIAIAR